MLDPIQNLSLRLCLGAFWTSPVESLQIEANEPPLSIRRNKLAIQYAIKIRSNPTNPTYQNIFEPQYATLFENRPKTIPPLSIRVQTVLNNINLDLTAVSSYQLPTICPWTLKLPKCIITLHSEKKCLISSDLLRAKFYLYLSDILNSFHIYTDGSKDASGVAAAAVSSTIQLACRLPSEASIYSAETQAIYLALKIVETSDDRPTSFLYSLILCLVCRLLITINAKRLVYGTSDLRKMSCSSTGKKNCSMGFSARK